MLVELAKEKGYEGEESPSIKTLQAWLRNTHFIYVSLDYNQDGTFFYRIYHKGKVTETKERFSYEEALEQGLIKGLNILK